MTPRTEFLIQNPKMIDALAIRSGLPYWELDDFRQEVILQSLLERDDFNPKLAKISTYAGNYIKMRVLNYMKKMRRLPTPYENLDYVSQTWAD